MNYKGLKESIIELLAGKKLAIDISSFNNDMTTFSSADDVLTLFIHLGYLGYDFSRKEVFIPNSEITTEFITSIRDAGWQEVVTAIRNSEELLRATWKLDNTVVAEKIQEAHFEWKDAWQVYKDESDVTADFHARREVNQFLSARNRAILLEGFKVPGITVRTAIEKKLIYHQEGGFYE